MLFMLSYSESSKTDGLLDASTRPSGRSTKDSAFAEL
jgi:hypothetical protein